MELLDLQQLQEQAQPATSPCMCEQLLVLHQLRWLLEAMQAVMSVPVPSSLPQSGQSHSYPGAQHKNSSS
jgi:hypothetical protein